MALGDDLHIWLFEPAVCRYCLLPAVAAVITAILSLSPWDLRQIAVWNQTYRLEQAVNAAGIGTGQILWTTELALKASSAIDYLAARPTSVMEIERIAAAVGLTIRPSELRPNEIKGLFKMGRSRSKASILMSHGLTATEL